VGTAGQREREGKGDAFWLGRGEAPTCGPELAAREKEEGCDQELGRAGRGEGKARGGERGVGTGPGWERGFGLASSIPSPFSFLHSIYSNKLFEFK
jgi:hypothetical protein